MPFSWKKKTRRNRFSQLVADHLQSPKRGGSLVVETGFPTSLIDLYVRNRGRFRKSCEKKQSENDSSNSLSSCSSSPSSGLVVDSSNLCSVSSSSGLDHRGTDEIVNEIVDDIVEEDVVVGVCVSASASDGEVRNLIKVEVERSVEMAKLNPVFAVMLKVLFVVILVLGTKRFTIGITMSAFVLLLLELVVKLLFRRKSVSESVSESSVYETENVKSLEEDTIRGVCSEVVEIEEELESNQEVRSEKELDEARSEVLMEIKHKSSRRALMKLRMKKLVPKKLRKSSGGLKEIEEETVKSDPDCKTLVLSSECSDSKGETLSILKQNQDKIVEIEGRSLSSTLSSEIDCDDKELGRELYQKSGCLVLCLVVLVGLIGGRALALALALSWCLIVKKLQRRNVKFPIS